MERISATFAMEWSIELEKALRSKKPGQAVMAIQQTAERIQQWSKEPKPIMAVYNMFGLVPGEDRLFANTILLRLADAFRSGDRETKLAIVRVFLLELKNRDDKNTGKQYRGILSKDRVNNQVELLKRVKIAFDTGDVESRALCLVLFGCWAHFAKDSAHIRYLIFSSMVSSEVLEVKASLFAAGCFCELADDFASVVLEMLLNMITSSETLPAIRIAGIRVFAKMGCSYSVANRAYQTGLKLILDFLEEDFVVTMLVSLSKLASRSTLLQLEQVNLLLSFFSQKKVLRLQATALRCLHFIVAGGVFHSTVSAQAIKTFSRIIDEDDFPVSMQCEALQVLHKMLLYSIPNLPQEVMFQLSPLLTTIGNSAESSIMSKSLQAIHVLADLSIKLSRRTEMEAVGNFLFPLPNQIISIIVDRVILLVKPLDLCQISTGVFEEVQNLLNLLLSLVREHPALGVLVLDKIRVLIEYIVDVHEGVVATRQASLSVSEALNLKGEKSLNISLKLAYYVHRFSVTCIEDLNEAGAITTQLVDKVKLLVQSVHRCSIFHWHVLTRYAILLHSHTIWNYVVDITKGICKPDGDLYSSFCYPLVEHEIFTLNCVKKMLSERDNWSAYKAGTFAACQGAWVTAAFVFEQLTSNVQSVSSSCWLKSLTQFAKTERIIQFFRSKEPDFRLADWSKMNESPIMLFRDCFEDIGLGAVESFSEFSHTEVLLRAHHEICSSRTALESIITSDKRFCFQKWFLALRVELLGTVVNVLKVLDTIPLNQDNTSNNRQVEKNDKFLISLQQITRLSFRFKRLAQEYDLISISFIGMDSRSSKIISTLASSCLLLAFATGLALSIPNLPANEILMVCDLKNANYSQMLVQNLIKKLWYMDQDTFSSLCILLGAGVQPGDSFHLSKSKKRNIGGEERVILDILNYVASGIVSLKGEASRNPNDEDLSQVIKDGFLLLLKTVTKWMHIPFQVPKYFFKIRPCVGPELFVFSADAKNSNLLCVLPGFNLSLNLCLQLRNLPTDLPVRLTRCYCVLYSSTSFQECKPHGETDSQVPWDSGASDTDDFIHMYEKLKHHAIACTSKTLNSKHGRAKDINADEIVCGFACFDLDGRRQGFSECLLDVSHFPVGSYRIKWQSCCIDNRGSYWSLLPLNAGPVFIVQKLPDVN